jgi:hypothetical protein
MPPLASSLSKLRHKLTTLSLFRRSRTPREIPPSVLASGTSSGSSSTGKSKFTSRAQCTCTSRVSDLLLLLRSLPPFPAAITDIQTFDDHLSLGSRSPYEVLGDGAGFVLAWSGSPRFYINQENKERELIQIEADTLVFASESSLVIDLFSHHSSDSLASPGLQRSAKPNGGKVS